MNTILKHYLIFFLHNIFIKKTKIKIKAERIAVKCKLFNVSPPVHIENSYVRHYLILYN